MKEAQKLTAGRRFLLFLAEGFGLGRLPLAPGTWGTIGGFLSLWLLHQVAPGWIPGSWTNPWIYLALLLAGLGLGVFASGEAENAWGADAQRIVWDEWLGYWFSMAMVPWSWSTALAGFILFRFFDVRKPFLARRAEHFSQGLGVMLDDVVAAMYTNILLHGAVYAGWLPLTA